MGRKRRHSSPKKKSGGGGLLTGMRGGFKGAVGSVTGAGAAKKKSSLLGNLVTVALVLLAGAMLMRRCGYVSF